MDVIETLDDYGKPAWITLMIVSFIVFWPLGLGILFYLFWSGRMGCGKRNGWKREQMKGWHNMARSMHSTGNNAFDEYRADTLRRLEQEAEEFRAFLERLRAAKDKAEFDQFMADRDKDPDAGANTVPATG
jgi:hypothetical protein